MRFVVVLLTVLGCAVLFVAGALFILIGIAEQRDADAAYVVGFVPGPGCDDAHELYVDTDDGAILDCVSAGISAGSGRVSQPGFTDDQNAQVATLVGRLGQDGLSIADQREIQVAVDHLAAAVPPADRPYGDHSV